MSASPPTTPSPQQKTIAFRDITDRGWQLNLLRAVRLPHLQKVVLKAIDDRGGNRPAAARYVIGCTASHATLAEDLGLHPESVGRAVRHLKAAGLVHATKIGCSGGSIVEDKRVCWSNLDDLWQEQQEAMALEAAGHYHPERPPPEPAPKTGTSAAEKIETNIETNIHSNIETNPRLDKTMKRSNDQELPPPPAPSGVSTPPAAATPTQYPKGWEKVGKALKARGVKARKRLCWALAASGVPIALAGHIIAQAGPTATPGGLYWELSTLGQDDIDEWIAGEAERQRARQDLAREIRRIGEAEGRREEEIIAMLTKRGVLEFDRQREAAPP